MPTPAADSRYRARESLQESLPARAEGVLYLAQHIAGHIQRGGGTGPTKPRQPPSSQREGANSRLKDLDVAGFAALRHTVHGEDRRGGVLNGCQSHLQCKECGAEYPLEALYVCERCFGPLEVALRPHARSEPTSASCAGGSRAARRTSGATPTSCRSPAGPPGRPGGRASRVGLPAGCTPLMRADRLAERLGLREVWVKNDAANPTHSFKDRVVSVAVTRARELGFETIACASTGQPRQLRRRPRRPRSGCDSYVFIPADLEEQKVLATGVYGTNVVGVRRQLRRRQPPLHRAVRREGLGVREHQPAALLRRGLQDARLRDRRAARLGAPRPLRRADRLRLAVHEDRRAASASGASWACSRASCRG